FAGMLMAKFKIYISICKAICGQKNRVLNVVDWHHRNGDRSDNRKSNCVALCPNCHAIKTRRHQ
ncbi:MAG: hypothetical protein WAM14_25205, partial [Candidatus Nitrosopolaris sp.]